MKTKTDFNADKYEVNCRSINAILKYAKQRNRDIAVLIEGLPYDEKYLTDTNNWICRQAAGEISGRLRSMFDDDEIMYNVGLASEKLNALGFLDSIARIVANPQVIIKNAPKFNRYFNVVDELEVLKSSSKGATIRYCTKPGYQMTIDDCYYTKGIFAALPTIWGLKPANVWEEACSVPIHKKGRIKGKFYTVDDKGYVTEHDDALAKSQKDQPKLIGRLNPDGTLKVGDTVYGAKHCLYHISWSPRKIWIKKIFYNIFTRPKVLRAIIDQMQVENDLIQKKYEEIYNKNLQLQKHYVDTISAFIRAIDAKDHYTEHHSIKVSHVAEHLAKELDLAANKIETIRQACKLHDLGKIGIKDSILLKPSNLNEEEWLEIKKHPVLGAEIIKPLTFLSDIAVLIREDHERWDGRGYPDGLRGEEIDIGARIIMVADAYDAMVSGRPYKKPLSKFEAIEEIKRNSGTQFDPKVVEAFLKIIPKIPPKNS